MTINEVIQQYKEKSCTNSACSEEYQQLAQWLEELQVLRKKNSATYSICRNALVPVYAQIEVRKEETKNSSDVITEVIKNQLARSITERLMETGLISFTKNMKMKDSVLYPDPIITYSAELTVFDPRKQEISADNPSDNPS